MRQISFFFSLAALCLPQSLSVAQEWPSWLGPAHSGVSQEKNLLESWTGGGPARLWSAKVGEGFSSPIGFEGNVYLFAQEGRNDAVTVFDADSGKVVWRKYYEATRPPPQSQSANSESGMALPMATPAIDSGHIYTYGGGGDLVCRSIADGTLTWRLNIIDQTRASLLAWGQASSPLITDKFVIVQDGAIAIAVDKANGKIAWTSQARGLGGYAAPVLTTVGKTQQLIILGGDALWSMDPQTGKTIWSQPWRTDYDVNASTPVYRDGHLFVTSNYDHGCAMYNLTETSGRKEWETKQVQSKFQPTILDGDRLYASDAGTLKCLHWPDGKLLWTADREPRLGDGGSFVPVGSDKMIALSERGKLFLLTVLPTGVNVAGQMNLFDESNVWSMPLVYHGKIYAKGKQELVCLAASRQ